MRFTKLNKLGTPSPNPNPSSRVRIGFSMDCGGESLEWNTSRQSVILTNRSVTLPEEKGSANLNYNKSLFPDMCGGV